MGLILAKLWSFFGNEGKSSLVMQSTSYRYDLLEAKQYVPMVIYLYKGI